ncbi:MAG: hypothetical protein UE295_12150 [Acutalibacteraceae bacterium]|nr:hypothetical protein [Acutalibacteraceae bacterium]
MRARKVTRTIKATEATLMVVDVATAEVQNTTITLSHEFKTADDIMKYVSKHTDLLSDGVKAVAVVDFIVTEQLYGMDEQKFIEYAEILPARN